MLKNGQTNFENLAWTFFNIMHEGLRWFQRSLKSDSQLPKNLFLFTPMESPLKLMKNAFFIKKIVEIFTFFPNFLVV